MNHRILKSDFVHLEPLQLHHAPQLFGLVDEQLWAGMTVACPLSIDDMTRYIQSQLDDAQRLSFAVLGVTSGEVVGATCLYDYAPSQRRVEIGSTFYGRDQWGGPTNPACKLLLLGHAFGDLGVQRVALRCDSRNERSIAAIKKLGAKHEGHLRSHRIAADGSTGDTAYFSILLDEWFDVRMLLEERLEAFRVANPGQ